MERGTNCLVVLKRKHMVIPSTKVMMKRFSQKLSSWEEVVDQDDHHQVNSVPAGGAHRGGGGGGGGGGGEWVWPPRSYSCSFCKREFRSAQALGGHMNVHRRDRAMLKQVVVSHNNIIIDPPPSDRRHDHDGYLRSPSKSMASPLYPSKYSHPRASVPHLSSPTRVSSSYYSQTSMISELKKVTSTNDVVQVKMSMGFDFSTRRYGKDEKEEEEEEKKLSSKRCKKSHEEGEGFALLPFFDEFKCSNAKGSPNPQATKSLEGLDLELRLGLV